ncbi:VanW family protein [Nocardioides pacificus]
MTPDPATTTNESKGGRVVVLLVLGLVLLFGALYAAAYAFAGANVPRGTTVSGVEVGGMSKEAAQDELEEELGERTSRTMTLDVDGRTQQVAPDKAGLSVDYAASVADAGAERSWSPKRLWDYYTGGDDLDAVVETDDESVDAVIERLNKGVGTPPVEGGIAFKGGKVKVTEPVVGEAVDPEETRDALMAAYLSEDGRAELELQPAPPEVDEADVQEALDEFANPAVSGPVTLVFDKSKVDLRPADIGKVVTMVAEDGELVPELDEKALTARVKGKVGDAGAPVDARIELVNGKPKVIKGKPGVDYDPADISDAFLETVVAPSGQREIEVKASVVEPDFTTEDARALKIKERVSTFTTYYPYAEYRNTNIGRAAEIIDGTVLEPGEVFSMNDIVGERTRENGFTEGFIISNGIFKEDLGGGVSQMATTLFNAMFFAGLKDVEHKPHSFYIDRYPVGREATVAWGAVDLRFENDTDYGVLVSAKVSPASSSNQGAVTVSMYSTKIWDIESVTGERHNFTQPQTRTLDTPDCYPNSGYAGFDIDVTRIFKEPGSGEVAKREVFSTTYTPSDSVVCKPPPAPGGGGGGGGGRN